MVKRQEQWTTDPSRLLEEDLSMPVVSETHIKSVSKELFTDENIDLKTELKHDEINNLMRCSVLVDLFGITALENATHNFKRHRVSLNRQSRKEFTDSLQTENRNAQGQNLFQKAFGGQNNNP